MMKNSFSKKLQQLYRNSTHFGNLKPESEMEQLVRYGCVGETSEKYFLFIYRDFFRNTPYYGAVIFLDKPDPIQDLPVTIIGLEENGKEQIRNIYVQVGLYFINNKNKNTMALAGKSALVFDLAREKLTPYQEPKPKPYPDKTDALDKFNFNLSAREITWKEIIPETTPAKHGSTLLKKHLELLETKKSFPTTDPDQSPVNAGPTVNPAAVIGISLVSQYLDLSGEKYFFFEPVLMPLKPNGKPGKPLKATPANTAAFFLDFGGIPELVQEFCAAFNTIEKLSSNRGLKARLLNGLFLTSLIRVLDQMPPHFCFCQLEKDKGAKFRRLFRVNIKHLHIQVAPHLKNDTVYRFFLNLTGLDGNIINVSDRFEIFCHDDQRYIIVETANGDVGLGIPVEFSSLNKILDFLSTQPEIKTFDLDDVINAITPLLSQHFSLDPVPLKKYELSFTPTPVFNVYFPDEKEARTGYRLELTFDYDLPVQEHIELHPDQVVCTYKRDIPFEKKCSKIVECDPFLTYEMGLDKERQQVFYYFIIQDNDFYKWLIERGRKYLAKGFKIFSMKWKRFIGVPGSQLQVRVSSDIDWLVFKPFIYDPVLEREVELSTDLDFEIFDRGMVQDKKGVLYTLTEEEIKKLEQLFHHAQQQGNHFRVPIRNHVLIGKLVDDQWGDLPSVKEAMELKNRLQQVEKIPAYPLGPGFNGQLRDYQLDGFHWLRFLKEFHLSGCLADDMGLGKTVQTLALLQTLKEENLLKRSLLVVPVSALPNWETEIQRFAPGLSYHIHLGPQRFKDMNKWENQDLVITSYGTLRSDIDWFATEKLDWVILDESQNIKNPASQVAQAVKALSCEHRLALSGTPIENNTLELWSLFDFLIPGFLGSRQWFQRELLIPIEKNHDNEKIDLLKKMIYPFILRRRKQEVEKDLPEKIEIISTLRMGDAQAMVYAETAQKFRDSLNREIAEKGVEGASLKILEAMLRLRQICLFPGLADEKFLTLAVPSAKFDYLLELIEDILAENHKVLIFSQFVQVLVQIRQYFDSQAIRYSYLDGSMPAEERADMVQRFQNEENRQVFLLSLKAGGVALNLTAADYVVIFDPWWNPAMEAQAIDRSHRIGQTKKVMVYRLVIKNSIEEKILQLQERKKKLVDDLVVSDSHAFKDLDKDDILNLFNF